MAVLRRNQPRASLHVILAILSLAPTLSAQTYKIAVVSMLHAHVWTHLRTMVTSDSVKFVGASETLPDLIEHANRESVPQSLIFADWKKMIDQAKPDIVWAFTPTNGHVEVVRYCAPKGIHVIVEKPLAATYDEALEIQSLAKKYGIQVLTNYGSTWQPSQYAIQSALDAGAIGPVWRLHGVMGHMGPGDPKRSSFAAWLADPVQNGGGALMDFGCYLVVWSLGLKGMPASVYATVQHLQPEKYPKVDDSALIVLNYKDGVAVLEPSWDLPPAERLGNEIYGLKGSIVRNTIRKPGQPDTQLTIPPLPPERREPIAYMVDHLRRHQPLDGPSALDLNVQVQEVLEAAKISVQTGREVKLPVKALPPANPGN